MNNTQHGFFPQRPRILFMGSPDFAVPALRALIGQGHRIAGVVTQPDRPKGRGRRLTPTPVKDLAMETGLEIFDPVAASEARFLERIRDLSLDLVVVVAYGQILKRDFLEIPAWGVLNIHASLLPKYRGAAPIQWAILNDEKKTGLTAMQMEEGLDSGPILDQEEVLIFPEETAGQLHDRLARLSGNFLVKTLEEMAEGRMFSRSQEDALASYAPKIRREMAWIKWERPAREVSALIRAMDPWPAAHSTLGEREVRLFLSGVADENIRNGVPGRIRGLRKGALEVEAGMGTIFVRELQVAGKRRIPAEEFLRGFPMERDSRFG